MMETVRIIVDVFNCLLEMSLAAFFFSAFQQLRVSKKLFLFILFFVSVGYTVLFNLAGPGYLWLLISLVLTFLVALCYRFTLPNALFMTAAVSVLSALMELVASMLFMIIGRDVEQALDNIYTYISGMLLSKFLTCLVIVIVQRGRHKLFQSAKGNHFIGIFLLPLASILVIMSLTSYLMQYSAGDFLQVLSIVSVLCLIAANVAIFYVVDRQYELINTRQRLKMSHVLLENQRQYYDSLFASQQEIRRMRHDLKHIFIAVLANMDNGDMAEARRIVESQLSDTERNIDYSSRVTDNVMNTVLYTKTLMAQQQGIQLVKDITVYKEIQIDMLDLAVLLANLLDNAIEAVARLDASVPREVELTIKADKDNLLISTMNPVLQDVDTHHIETIKSDKKNHGFGLQSIKSIVEKYHGTYAIQCENRVFCFTAVVPNTK